MAKIKLNGDTSGYIEISAPAVSGNNTLELGPGTKILTNLDNTFTGITTFSDYVVIGAGVTANQINVSGISTFTGNSSQVVMQFKADKTATASNVCLLYTSPSPRDPL